MTTAGRFSRIRGRRVVVLAVAAAVLGGPALVGQVAHAAPPAGTTAATRYFGIFQEATPTAIAASAKSTYGVTPASVLWFDSWGTNQAFPVSEAKALVAQGIMPHFTWEPWYTALAVTDSGQIHLNDIINGKWDTYIKARGAEFAQVGAPIFVRWGHEFNGTWYPWSNSNNNNDPTLYIKAYRHVHDLVVAAGATNVKWVWAYNNGSSPVASWNEPAQAYPGSAYVDWIGLDGYNWGLDPSWDPTGNHWTTFRDLFTTAYSQAQAIDSNKPIMVSEYASSEDGGDKAGWINDMSSAIGSGAFPSIKLYTYFDTIKEERWAGTSSSAVQTAFTAWLKQPFMNGTGTTLAQITTAN